ncbi:hypothetical protein A3A09_02615 [Candidatus Nomurabacteria bacterium RIFCSPLOWO2_01_FULL_42_20]|uniref:tRNA (guanine-N(1)-)-methyltransferase n=1 Tax=Candidatus Nomurabacteria bacterium RIFCSPHIGHO2_01_FULL_42_16 TaxID=1801743 RepID=A0A1F6VLE8_9BACT|nr:MAG: hypothetical protein A2824_03765 [Candidatus Nomurabacteria bacterium RIFCSPHIGHO2_01_FULL_42_16]OGI92652.1 MAG: hypothetical protein A3A09_02615 [Candidatus Nomurabacteria bacterium RIFCSPLOWO2_01_FULL_42_20]
MVFHIITLFPEAFDSYLKESIIGRAIKNKKIKIKFYNPFDFAQDLRPRDKKKKWFYRQADDRPYGGGPGMVMLAMPIIKIVEKILRGFLRNTKILRKYEKKSKLKAKNPQLKVVIFSPSGKKFSTAYAKNTAKKYTDIILICGRYEGIDARVKKVIMDMGYRMEDISIGDYVLTGGELPAMVLIDSVSRQIPGVLHKYESLEEERISTSEVYTRPEVFRYPIYNPKLRKSIRNLRKSEKRKITKEYRVPKVLLSGDHKKIAAWRLKRQASLASKF